MKSNHNLLKFGNWVPVKMISGPGLIGLILLALGFFHWLFLLAAAPFLLAAAYFAISYYLFSVEGGNIQNRVLDLLVTHINWDGNGKALDIGCGNGPLTLKLAKTFPKAEVVGLDYWGKNWDYSMTICNENARRSGLEGRVSFQHGSASKLPFEDARFNLVVSNLAFHEVQDVDDKRISIREALRVLKPGGIFVLQDLFLINNYYGTPEELLGTIEGWDVDKVEFLRTCDESFIPRLVKLPFMLGTLAILSGVK
jgi:SAM-dependent methyltransferase